MFRRKSIACAVALATAGAGLSAGPAAGAGPRNATLDGIGTPTVKINRWLRDNNRFSKDVVRVRSGGTITLRSRNQEPHSFTVVKRRDQPRTVRAMNGCYAEDGLCIEFFGLHQISETDESAGQPVVNAGDPGFNQAGDSALFLGDPVKIDITADAGKRLYFFCLFHPQMQGRVNVG